MVKRYWLVLILFLPCLSFAQTPSPTPAPTPVPTPIPVPRAVIQQPRIFETFEQRAKLEELRKREELRKEALNIVNEKYRKPSKKELKSVEVENDLLSKYAYYLKQENAGIIKLLNNAKCANNTNVVVASDNCLNNTMPGAGTSFSFRINNYRIPDLADLSLNENTFRTNPDWQHGILVDIGNIQIENISLQSTELAFINSFQPALEYQTAKEIDYKLASGIRNNNFVYRRSALVRENTTYILRSIAYRGKLLKSIKGFVYNELDYDKRKDIIVAFRVVRQYSDGSVTILWKQLASKDSPKIDFEKKDKLADLKYR